MKKLVLLSAALLTTQIILAQNQKTVNVYFDVDEHYLTEESVNTLDKLIEEIKYYDVKNVHLAAHTDHDASDSYNQALSERRANSVSSYLYEAGIRSEAIESSWFGERKPAASNSTDEGKQLNRRVELRVQYVPFKTVDELLDELKDPVQKFRLNTTGSTTIIGEDGIEITIPEDAFMTSTGVNVANKEVLIELEEALDAGESFINQLSTQSNDKLLETGGMLRVDGYYAGKKLKLRPGKELKINIPNSAEFEDMSVFTGDRGADGVMNWNNTPRAFEAVKATAKGASILFNTEILKRFIKVPGGYFTGGEYQAALNFPSRPVRPSVPRKPYEPQKPDPETVFSGLKNWIATDAMKARESERQYRELLKKYEERMVKYNRFMDSYSDRMVKYESDMISYKESIAQVHSDIEAHLEKLEQRFDLMKTIYDQERLNAAIMDFSKKVDAGEVRDIDFMRIFADMANRKANTAVYKELQKVADFYHYYNYLLKFSADYIDKKFVHNGELKIHRAKKYCSGGSSLLRTKLYSNSLYSLLASNEEIRKLVDDAIEAKMQSDYEKGIVTSSSLSSFYSAVTPNMGWINCDRFSQVDPKQMVSIGLFSAVSAKIMVYVSKLKSMINANGGNVRLPKNTEYKAIFISTVEGKPHLYVKEGKVEYAIDIEAKMKPASLNEIRQAMNAL